MEAEAGGNRHFSFLQNITLDSQESAGPITSYQWELVAGRYSTTLTNADTAQPEIYLPQDGTYPFKLTVADADGNTDIDYVTLAREALPLHLDRDQSGYINDTFALSPIISR